MVFLNLFFFVIISVLSQHYYESEIVFLKDEHWWGALVAKGNQMPFIGSIDEIDLSKVNLSNQSVPLLVSNKGRYIWSEEAFKFKIEENVIQIQSTHEEVVVKQAGTTLRDAYLHACQNYFPPSGVIPDSLMFSMPQYNTWIELMYNQNQKDILKYAEDIIKHGFPPGVLMIDDNWQKYYGNLEFKPEKFSDPKGMIRKLHESGFKVMLWICPFVSADSPEYRDLAEKGYLIKQKGNQEPAMIRWWNGYSACFDFTNPDAEKHFVSMLNETCEKFGVDGYKLDAGDIIYYDVSKIESFKQDATSADHSMAWSRIGLHFPFNEYRATWKMGNQALVQRLCDKDYSWEAINLLIPDMLSAGLMGYAYTCPDMIGGGSFTDFIGIDSDAFDQKLIVRSTQTHALMPMMQFSVAPWRILNEENLEICRQMAHLHVSVGKYILDYARNASKTGEPIIRHMEYVFPHQGFAKCKDQFMLGDKYLVAPVLTSGTDREVKLPEGQWKDDLGNIYKGGKIISVVAGVERLPFFEKIKN